MELTGKLKEQVAQAKSFEQAKGIIEDAGMKLTDDELDTIVGGLGFQHPAPKSARDDDETSAFDDSRFGQSAHSHGIIKLN